MTEIPSLKERQVSRLDAQNPVKAMTCRNIHLAFRQYPEHKKRTGYPVRQTENHRRNGWLLPMRPEKLRGGWSAAMRHFPCLAKTKRVLRLISRSSRTARSAIREVVEHYSGLLETIASLFWIIFTGRARPAR
jgi:hypothetical protein